jgi:hypothetical protein
MVMLRAGGEEEGPVSEVAGVGEPVGDAFQHPEFVVGALDPAVGSPRSE